MTISTQFGSVREYLLHYANSLPKEKCYYNLVQSDQRVVNSETFYYIFENVVVYVDNYVFALIDAIDTLIDQEVLGVSYEDFSVYANHIIKNPTACISDDIEQEIMDDIIYNIENYWMYPKIF